MTPNRLRLLEEVGFIWDALRGRRQSIPLSNHATTPSSECIAQPEPPSVPPRKRLKFSKPNRECVSQGSSSDLAEPLKEDTKDAQKSMTQANPNLILQDSMVQSALRRTDPLTLSLLIQGHDPARYMNLGIRTQQQGSEVVPRQERQENDAVSKAKAIDASTQTGDHSTSAIPSDVAQQERNAQQINTQSPGLDVYALAALQQLQSHSRSTAINSLLWQQQVLAGVTANMIPLSVAPQVQQQIHPNLLQQHGPLRKIDAGQSPTVASLGACAQTNNLYVQQPSGAWIPLVRSLEALAIPLAAAGAPQPVLGPLVPGMQLVTMPGGTLGAGSFSPRSALTGTAVSAPIPGMVIAGQESTSATRTLATSTGSHAAKREAGEASRSVATSMVVPSATDDQRMIVGPPQPAQTASVDMPTLLAAMARQPSVVVSNAGLTISNGNNLPRGFVNPPLGPFNVPFHGRLS